MKINRRSGAAAVLALLTAVLMVFALAGCGKSEPAQEEQPAEAPAAEEPAAEEPTANMANPWTDVKTAEEAAEGAGVGTFECAGIETSLGTTEPEVYRWMKGIAEAQIPIAAVDMTIRKGTEDAAVYEAENGMGDISGDYSDYKYTWTQNVGDVAVQCKGNRKGESTNTTWKAGDYYYSITAFGAGGDDDFGLSKKDVKALVGSIK